MDTAHHLIWIWWLLAPKKWRWRWLKRKKTQGLRTASVPLNWFAGWSWSQVKSLRDCCMLSIFLYSLCVKPAGNDSSSGCSDLPVYPGTAVCVTSTGSILLKSSKVGNTYTNIMVYWCMSSFARLFCSFLLFHVKIWILSHHQDEVCLLWRFISALI